jgi:hypothetical protein
VRGDLAAALSAPISAPPDAPSPPRSQERRPGRRQSGHSARHQAGRAAGPGRPVLPDRGLHRQEQGRGVQGPAAGAEHSRGGDRIHRRAHRGLPEPVPGAARGAARRVGWCHRGRDRRRRSCREPHRLRSLSPGALHRRFTSWDRGGGCAGCRRARSDRRPSHAGARRSTPAVGWGGLGGPHLAAAAAALQVVVVTDCSLEESQRIDEICHKHSPPIAFIHAETRGVFASVFCDFGPSFTVIDVDGGRADQSAGARSARCMPSRLEWWLAAGAALRCARHASASPSPRQTAPHASSAARTSHAGEEPHKGIVASISTGSPAVVTCVEDERLEFQVGWPAGWLAGRLAGWPGWPAARLLLADQRHRCGGAIAAAAAAASQLPGAGSCCTRQGLRPGSRSRAGPDAGCCRGGTEVPWRRSCGPGGLAWRATSAPCASQSSGGGV